jgi:GGDEF domain-containing protein
VLAAATENARTELSRARAFDRALLDSLPVLDSLSVGVVACDATGQPTLVDGFKAINDTAGHAAGDAALLHAARPCAARSAPRHPRPPRR